MNAHIAKAANKHYQSHNQTKNILSPDTKLSICKIDENTFDNYVSLEKLSRRARYLCNDDGSNDEIKSYITYDKHLTRAIKRLNIIMLFFNKQYNQKFEVVKVTCPRVKAELPSLEFFVK